MLIKAILLGYLEDTEEVTVLEINEENCRIETKDGIHIGGIPLCDLLIW